jgi:hypothetical protein
MMVAAQLMPGFFVGRITTEVAFDRFKDDGQSTAFYTGTSCALRPFHGATSLPTPSESVSRCEVHSKKGPASPGPVRPTTLTVPEDSETKHTIHHASRSSH